MSDHQSTIKHNVNPRSVGVLERDWTTALILSIFLGWIGIDQFYLGKTGKGILKLFTLGLFGILWIIDVIMIATKSVRGVVWQEEKGKGNWFNRHKVLAVIGAVVVIAVIASILNGGGSGTTNTTKSSAAVSNTTKAKSKTQPVIKIGQPANDGKFQFIVTSVKCGNPSVHDSTGYISKNAQGQYCLLNISVKNIGNEAQTLDSSSQYLYNSSDQKFSSDDEATIDINPTSGTFLNDINPGNTVTGTVVFDIPKGQTPVKAELHDSALSNGVTVSLQ